jgi:hypothetical protein
MTTLRGGWPSAGFWVFASSWTALATLLAWGMTEPDLDRAWRILGRMERPGFAGMSPRDVRVLSRSLQRHPSLIEALSGNRIADFVEPTEQKWIAYREAHLAVRPQPNATIRIWTESRASSTAYPLTVRFRASWLDETVAFDKDDRKSFELPEGQPVRAELVRVSVVPADGVPADGHFFEIRVTGEALIPQQATP